MSRPALADSLDIIKAEFDLLSSEVVVARRERDECEATLTSQVNELNLIRQSLYELETRHGKLRHQYEEDLTRLRAELHSVRQGLAPQPPPQQQQQLQPHPTHPHPHHHRPPPPPPVIPVPAGTQEKRAMMPMPMFEMLRERMPERMEPRERERDRDRERERERERVIPEQRPLAPAPAPVSDVGRERERERENRERERERETREREREQRMQEREQRMQERENNRERERERERDRDRERDPKRLKADRAGRAVAPPSRVDTKPPTPVTPAVVEPPEPTFLEDLDLATIPPHLKKESTANLSGIADGSEWFAVWNPTVKHKRIVDVSLMHTLLHESVVCCVRFSKDGRFLATGCNRTAQVYDARTGTKVCSLIDPSVPKGGDLYIRSVCFSPDGALLATGAEDTQIRIWDIAKKRIISVLSGHQQEIYALDFSADGRFVVSGSGDKTVRIWDMRGVSAAASSALTISSPVTASPGGSAGAGAAGLGPSPPCQVLTITDTAPPTSPAIHRTSPAPTPDGGITSVAIAPNGLRVAAGSLDALVRVWDVRSGALVRRLRGHGDSVYSVAFVPEGGPRGALGLVSGGLDRTVRGWDLCLPPTPGVALQGWKEPGSGPVLQGWKAEGGGQASGSGTNAASGSGSGVLKGWKEGDDEGRCLMTFTGHKDYVLSVAVSHDAEWVVSGSKDRGVQFWDAKTGVVQCMLQGHKNSVISIDLSPAGNVLATGSGDWHARIWSYDAVP
ncbi:WD40-repeat-containing domain protein [Mycena filopes]|nr:WD40-repeat-containing domain protein [Mycena filopes]